MRSPLIQSMSGKLKNNIRSLTYERNWTKRQIKAYASSTGRQDNDLWNRFIELQAELKVLEVVQKQLKSLSRVG